MPIKTKSHIKSTWTNKDFTEWRKIMGLTQVEAAELLGLHKRTVQMYDLGVRPDGEPCRLPMTIELACRYLTGTTLNLKHLKDLKHRLEWTVDFLGRILSEHEKK